MLELGGGGGWLFMFAIRSDLCLNLVAEMPVFHVEMLQFDSPLQLLTPASSFRPWKEVKMRAPIVVFLTPLWESRVPCLSSTAIAASDWGLSLSL